MDSHGLAVEVGVRYGKVRSSKVRCSREIFWYGSSGEVRYGRFR